MVAQVERALEQEREQVGEAGPVAVPVARIRIPARLTLT